MTIIEALQFLNLLLIPIGLYIVKLERRLVRFEVFMETTVKESDRMRDALAAAHRRLDAAGAPPAGAK